MPTFHERRKLSDKRKLGSPHRDNQTMHVEDIEKIRRGHTRRRRVRRRADRERIRRKQEGDDFIPG